MCCPLDQLNGKLILQHIAYQKSEDEEPADIIHVKGVYDRTPSTFGDRFSRYFQRLELLEKIAEIVDECFHLFNPIFQRYTNLMTYQTLRNLHHGAHDIEHVLHSFCFLGDVTRLVSGTFFQDTEGNQLDYLRSISRICHATSHCLATARFLNELKLCALDQFEKAFKYATVLSTFGYALWTISLVWQRHQGKANDQFAEDMCIHLGGCIFEAVHIVEDMEVLSPSVDYAIGKVGSLAGMIHAWCVVKRLMPKDSEEVEFELVLPEAEDHKDEEEHSPSCHHHHHHHSHSHHIRYYPVKTKKE